MADVAVAERTLPHNLEAERSVLGAILLHNDAFNLAAEVIDAGDFFREAHRRIFNKMVALTERGDAIDLVTLKEELGRSGDLEEVGGPAYITALVDGVPRSTNVEHYARIIKEKATLRSLIFSANKILATAYEAEEDADAILDQAEHAIFAIADRKIRDGFVSLRELAQGSLDTIERLHARKELITGVPTGFTDLDRLTSGLQEGDLIVIAGRPSMGKTAFALNVAEYIALSSRVKLPVAVFSMEMGATQLAMRLIGSVGRLDQHKIRTGQLSPDDWERLSDALGRLSDAAIHIDETAALNALELRARARRLARQYGGKLGAIVVDYLQLMQAVAQGENRATEISEISRSLKALAKELQVPVIALSQLNRSLEQRPNKRPIMSDLRESGAIEQDSDLILFIYRDEVYNEDTQDKGVAEIIVGKQRNGPIGTVKLAFLGQYTRFENLAQPGTY